MINPQYMPYIVPFLAVVIPALITLFLGMKMEAREHAKIPADQTKDWVLVHTQVSKLGHDLDVERENRHRERLEHTEQITLLQADLMQCKADCQQCQSEHAETQRALDEQLARIRILESRMT